LLEFSSYCKNDCYYCGLRRSNGNVTRYRLTEAEILDCCRIGHDLGFRTFVLQSGEDMHFTDDRLCGIISGIKERFPDCAVTLSIGERNRDSY
jgi:biotin synthase